MDIEEFDRLYPSPAHAAAADLRDRYAPRDRGPEDSGLDKDRSGAVIATVALAASVLGGIAYVSNMTGRLAPSAPVTRVVQAQSVPVVSGPAVSGPVVSGPVVSGPVLSESGPVRPDQTRRDTVVTPVPASDQPAHPSSLAAVTHRPTVESARIPVTESQTTAVVKTAKSISPSKRSSTWILEPLSGDALAAALIIDKKRTIELNAKQLGAIETSENGRSTPHAAQ